MKGKEMKSIFLVNAEAFADAANAAYSIPASSAYGDAEKSIEEARRLASDRMDNATMAEGEKIFRRMIKAKQ